jgi:hypothetical protein
MKRLLSTPVALLLLPALLSLAACPAHAEGGGSSQLSHASEALSAATGLVVLGSLSAVGASGYVVVAGVEAVGEGVIVVLKGASDAADVSIRMSATAAQGLSDAVGKAVTVTATSTGHVLVMSGKTLAFIPNEVGKSLLHHSAVES